MICTLFLKEDPYHTVSFSFTSFSTAVVAGRLRIRDAELLCEMQHSYVIAKIIIRNKRKRGEIAISSLQFPKCWSEFCAMQKRHSCAFPLLNIKILWQTEELWGFLKEKEQQPLELKSIAGPDFPSSLFLHLP